MTRTSTLTNSQEPISTCPRCSSIASLNFKRRYPKFLSCFKILPSQIKFAALQRFNTSSSKYNYSKHRQLQQLWQQHPVFNNSKSNSSSSNNNSNNNSSSNSSNRTRDTSKTSGSNSSGPTSSRTKHLTDRNPLISGSQSTTGGGIRKGSVRL